MPQIPIISNSAMDERRMQQKMEIGNMAIKFGIAVISNPTFDIQKPGNEPAKVQEFCTHLAEKFHGYVTMPDPESTLVS